MARPVPRRRGEREAPDADAYTGRRGRGQQDEPAGDERRPRRGRGELPAQNVDLEERTVDGTLIPTTEAELEKVDDVEYDDLLKHFDIPEGLSESVEFTALWDAIEASREPKEPPRRGRGRAAEEPDEPPRRGRGRAAEDEPADEPRGRGRGRSDEPAGDAPRGRGRGRDADDDAPRRTPRAGFEGFKRARAQTFTGDFKLTPEELLVKFLDDEPFDTFVEHGLYKELKDGQRVWICIEDDCPICNVGHTGKAMSLWNIVVIPEEGDPRHEVLKAGPGLTKELETKAALKTGPLSKEYYSLSQPEQKKGEQVKGPNVEVVRERDVLEDWKFQPFTDDELDDFRQDCPDPTTYLQFPSRADLVKVAKQLRDAD